jgi:heat shock protein HslJ
MKTAALLLVVAASCGYGQVSKYLCPGGEKVEVRRVGSGILVQAAGKPRLTLQPAIATSGALYSDGYTTVSFKGKELAIEAGSINVRNCQESEVDYLTGRWTLVELQGKTVPRLPRQAMLEFLDGGRVSGTGGCNRFSGSFTRSAEAVDFGVLTATRMACLSATAQQLENQFLALVQGRLGWKAAEGRLELRNAAGEIVLVFDRQL